jgi:catechol 2,3-dioxygenase-like lactoylglutathione lyase family enzyme
MPDPLPIEAVNHVAVMTRRLEQSIAFYRDVLGFREVSRPHFDFRGAWLYNYGVMIHIIENASAGDPTDWIDTRDNHLALHSSDLETVERLLGEHRIRYRKNLIPDRAIRQIFFQDPDGNHIEIGDYPPTPPYLD